MNRDMDMQSIMKFHKYNTILNISKIGRPISFFAFIVFLILSILLPSHRIEDRPKEYTPFHSDLSFLDDCTVEFAEDDILTTISTIVTRENNGTPFVKVPVNYHLVGKDDGSLFFVKTTEESNANVAELAGVFSISEGDMRKAFSEGKNKVTFYGCVSSAPLLTENTASSFHFNDKALSDKFADLFPSQSDPVDSDLVDRANELLSSYPVIDIESSEPETRSVNVGIGAGTIFMYLSIACLILSIGMPIVTKIMQGIINRASSGSQYLN